MCLHTLLARGRRPSAGGLAHHSARSYTVLLASSERCSSFGIRFREVAVMCWACSSFFPLPPSYAGACGLVASPASFSRSYFLSALSDISSRPAAVFSLFARKKRRTFSKRICCFPCRHQEMRACEHQSGNKEGGNGRQMEGWKEQ